MDYHTHAIMSATATATWDPTVNTGLVEPQDTLLAIGDAKKDRRVPHKYKPGERWDSVVDLGLSASFAMHARLVTMHDKQLGEEIDMELRAKKMGADLRAKYALKQKVKDVVKMLEVHSECTGEVQGDVVPPPPPSPPPQPPALKYSRAPKAKDVVVKSGFGGAFKVSKRPGVAGRLQAAAGSLALSADTGVGNVVSQLLKGLPKEAGSGQALSQSNPPGSLSGEVGGIWPKADLPGVAEGQAVAEPPPPPPSPPRRPSMKIMEPSSGLEPGPGKVSESTPGAPLAKESSAQGDAEGPSGSKSHEETGSGRPAAAASDCTSSSVGTSYGHGLSSSLGGGRSNSSSSDVASVRTPPLGSPKDGVINSGSSTARKDDVLSGSSTTPLSSPTALGSPKGGAVGRRLPAINQPEGTPSQPLQARQPPVLLSQPILPPSPVAGGSGSAGPSSPKEQQQQQQQQQRRAGGIVVKGASKSLLAAAFEASGEDLGSDDLGRASSLPGYMSKPADVAPAVTAANRRAMSPPVRLNARSKLGAEQLLPPIRVGNGVAATS